MSDDDDDEKYREQLVNRLPEELRQDWAVVPKHTMTIACLASLLLGVAFALMVVGFVLETPALRWVWPSILIAMMLAAKFWPWWRGDRYVEQLRRARVGGDRQPPGAAGDAAQAT